MRFIFLLVLSFLLATANVFTQSDSEKQLFDYMNSEREREGIRPLIWDQELYEVARAHSKDMAAMHKVSHTGSDHSEPDERVLNAKIFASKTAENIAGDINVISAHTSLMKSLHHRENILDPEVTHGADAIYDDKGYLYITEVFIQKVKDYSLEDARKRVLEHINDVRNGKHLAPLGISKTLSNVAQSHMEVQVKMKKISPLLILSALSKQMRGPVLVNVYTTDSLDTVPEQVAENFVTSSKTVGIGFERTQGGLCPGGCYVIALIFASSEPQPEGERPPRPASESGGSSPRGRLEAGALQKKESL
jgi:uncharacterized protein YkwD